MNRFNQMVTQFLKAKDEHRQTAKERFDEVFGIEGEGAYMTGAPRPVAANDAPLELRISYLLDDILTGDHTKH